VASDRFYKIARRRGGTVHVPHPTREVVWDFTDRFDMGFAEQAASLRLETEGRTSSPQDTD